MKRSETTLLVGCGYWGQNWAKTLYHLKALGAICEPNLATQWVLREMYPDVPLYDDLEQALTHPGLKAVVIATPVSTHPAMASTCLMADKSVLVEKPMTLTEVDAQTLVTLAEDRGVKLAVGHLLMYHPALLTLQQLIRVGELGDVLSVQCTRVNLGKVRNEETCWWSLAPHDISILSMLLGEPFEVVSASKMNPLGRPGIEDMVYAGFITPSGRSASIHVSWLSPTKRHETVVTGTRKIAVFEDTQALEKKLLLMDYQLERDGDRVQSVRRGDASYVPLEMPRDLLTLEAQAFLSAVEQGHSLQNDGWNGLEGVRILETVQSLLNERALCATV